MVGKLIIAGVCLLAVCGSAHANDRPAKTGSDYLRQCANLNWDQVNVADCEAFALGVASGLMFWRSVSPQSASICIPGEVNSDQLRQVTINWLIKHPERQQYLVSSLMAVAFAEAWPCPK
jgi:Rap1a immunity proteins